MLRRKNNYMTLDPPLNSWKFNIVTMVLELDDARFGSALGHDDLFNQSKVLQFGRTGPMTFEFTSENWGSLFRERALFQGGKSARHVTSPPSQETPVESMDIPLSGPSAKGMGGPLQPISGAIDAGR